MILLCLLATAAGEDTETTDSGAPTSDPSPSTTWAPLPAPDDDFGSALAPLRGEGDPLAHGRFTLRPRLARVGLVEGVAGTALGAAIGHQWWQLSGATLRFAGESRLDLLGRVGGASGPDLHLTSAHGAWLGSVGLLAGPALRYDALTPETSGPGLSAGLTVGPQVRLAVDLGPLLPWAALTPAWVVAGPRPPGREDTLDVGVDLSGRHLDLRLVGALRQTPGVDLWEAGLGLHPHL